MSEKERGKSEEKNEPNLITQILSGWNKRRGKSSPPYKGSSNTKHEGNEDSESSSVFSSGIKEQDHSIKDPSSPKKSKKASPKKINLFRDRHQLYPVARPLKDSPILAERFQVDKKTKTSRNTSPSPLGYKRIRLDRAQTPLPNPELDSNAAQDNSEENLPNFFWEAVESREEYFAIVEENRELLMNKVKDWYNKTNSTLAFILPLFTQGMNNLNRKIIQLGDVWILTKENFETVYMNESLVIKSFKEYTPVDNYNEIHKGSIREEGRKNLHEFMNQFFPILEEHKFEQRKIMEYSLQRLKREIITPLKEEFQKLKKNEFKEADLIHQKAHKWLKTVKVRLDKKKRAYEKFMDLVTDNQTALVKGKSKRPKKDTLKSLIRLSIFVGELLNSLVEIEKMIIEIWQIYEDISYLTKSCITSYYSVFSEIMPDYFFPEDKTFRKNSFKKLGNQRPKFVYNILTLLKPKEIELAKKMFEVEVDFSFNDLCQYYRAEMLENFEDYIGKSWTLEDRKTKKCYWVTLSQDMYLNIFALMEKNGRLQSAGQALISDSVHGVGVWANGDERSISFKGYKPGAFFRTNLTFFLETMEDINDIFDCLGAAKGFCRELGI